MRKFSSLRKFIKEYFSEYLDFIKENETKMDNEIEEYTKICGYPLKPVSAALFLHAFLDNGHFHS